MSVARALPRRLAVAVVCSLVAVACSGGGDDDGSTDTTTTTASPGETSISVGPDPDPTLLPVDDDVRIGTLDNGLTYYLRRNDSPGGRLSLRLAVDAGSLHDPSDGAGTAHFVEHMLFNGTENFTAVELDDALADIGVQTGAHVNAFTSMNETVYRLTVPTADQADVDLAFRVLRDFAGSALFEPGEVEAERGVVREEFRLRRTSPDGQVLAAFHDVYYAGTPYEGKDPIGVVDAIETMQPETLRAYYERWYRPDNMAVVVVGDLAVGRLEDLVTRWFSDLDAGGDAPEPPARDIAVPPEPVVELVAVDENPASFVSVDYPTPDWDRSTVGGQRLLMLERLAGVMINARLEEDITAGRVELDRGSGGFFNDSRTWRALGFNVQGDDLLGGARAVFDTVAAVRAGGFDAAEMERAIGAVRASADQLLATVDSRQDEQWTDLYVAHFLQGGDISSPRDSHRRVVELIDSLDVQEVNAHVSWLLDRSAPLVVIVTADERELPASADVLTALADSEANLDAVRAEVADLDDLMQRPAPVDEVSRRRLDRVSLERRPAVSLRFENGATVVYAESAIAAGNVSVVAVASGGWSLLGAGDAPLAGLAARAVSLSGFEDVERVALDRFLADEVVGASPWIDESEEGISGGAATEDLELLFQLLHLLLTEPAVDEPAVRRAVREAREDAASSESDALAAAAERVRELRHGEDPTYRLHLDDDELDAVDSAVLLELYRSRFVGVDDLVVAVVGDVPEHRVEDLARRYIATLPTRDADTGVAASQVESPVSARERIVVGDGAQSGAVVISHRVPTAVGLHDDVTLDVLAEILQNRLVASIREELGATYSAQVSAAARPEPFSDVEIVVWVTGDPDRLDVIESTVIDHVEELAAFGPGAVELAQAVQAAVNEADLVNNGEILDGLLGQVVAPALVATPPEVVAHLEALDRGAVEELAALVLDPAGRVTVLAAPR